VPARVHLAIFLVASFLIVAAAAVVFAGGPDEPDRTAAVQGALRPPGIPPADFRLVDENERPVTLADLEGRPAIVTFLYSTCDDTCPVIAQQIVAAMDRLGRDVPAVAIAVDPPRDTPARARRFLAEQRAAGRIRFLTGPADELRRQWRAYGIQHQTDAREHSGYVVLLDRTGRQRIGFPVGRLTPEALASDLALLDEQD
jgi:protein SCO1